MRIEFFSFKNKAFKYFITTRDIDLEIQEINMFEELWLLTFRLSRNKIYNNLLKLISENKESKWTNKKIKERQRGGEREKERENDHNTLIIKRHDNVSLYLDTFYFIISCYIL